MKSLFLYFLAFAALSASADEILPLEVLPSNQLVVNQAGSVLNWDTAPEINAFYKSYPDVPSAYPVSVKLLYRGTELFIKAVMKGEKESGMPASAAEPAKCEFMWTDSCFNFYMDPDKSDKDAYYHFINSKGVSFQFGPDISKGWKGDWSAETQRDENKGEWSAIIRCNLGAMKGAVSLPGSVWGINFNRHVGEKTGRLLETSGWPLNHYKPSSKYAALIFGPLAKEKIRIDSPVLIKKDGKAFLFKFKISPAINESSIQIKISSRNKAGETVFSGKAVFADDGPVSIPFEWDRTKDGRHLLEIVLRDEKGLVRGISDYAFSLSSAPLPDTEKPMIWPEPASWKNTEGFWTMPEKLMICLNGKGDFFPAELLKTELEKRYGVGVEIISKMPDGGKNLIVLDYEKMETDAFALNIKPDIVRIRAQAPKFMYYGVRAFIDMVRLATGNNFEARAKCGECLELPGVKRRAFMFYPEMGLAENVKPDVNALKKLIYEQVAGGRYDMLILMIKGAMKYDSHPELLNNPEYRGKYYTKAEIKELIDYGRRHYLELIPGSDSPGHSEWIGVPRPDLREDGNPEIVCTKNPETMKLLKDTYSELLELFAPCDYLFISGGEIFYSTALTPEEKRCRLCKGIDKGALLLEHWKQLNDFCAEKKVRPVIWSDMISKDWNGGGRWQTWRIFDSLPRNITITSWDPADNRTVQPREIIEKGFPPPWRITTVFAEQQYDAFLKNYNHYKVEGIAEDYPYLWCNFQSASVETSCSYTTPAIHLFADCAWNPSTAGEDYFRHINSRGPYWSRLMNVPEWGVRKLEWTPVSVSQSSDLKDPLLPEGITIIGGLPFDFGKGNFNALSVTGKGSESKSIRIMEKLAGMAFIHNLSAERGIQEKLHRYFKNENKDQYGISAAFIRIIYEDGQELDEALKLGWNTHFKDCYPPARVMPGADFYWTCASEKQKRIDTNSPDLCCWITTWKNPRPDIVVREIKLCGNSEATVLLYGVSTAKAIRRP